MGLTNSRQKRRYAAVLRAVPVGAENAIPYSEITERVQAAGHDLTQTSVAIYVGRARDEGDISLAPAGDRVHRWYREPESKGGH